MKEEEKSGKKKIEEFMSGLSKKLEEKDGDGNGKKTRYLMRLDKSSEEFKAIARASADLEDFPMYLEELSQMASKRWLEIRKTMNAAWKEFALKYGYSTLGDYLCDRKTGEIKEVLK